MAAQVGAPLHFELYIEEDDMNYIRWKWISKKEAHRVLRGIDGRLLRRSGLHDALWMDWARPEEGTTSVREFVLNWDDRTQSSTVGGREIPLTIDTMREYFLLPEGLNPPRSARHYDELSDWVPERSKTAKTWYANDVYLPMWRKIIQLINVVLLGKQKPLEVTGAFLYIFKNKVGPADEDEHLDWATYFKEKVREEIRACKKQMQASGKRKVRPTCIGIVVLHILRTCGIVDDIVLSDSDKSVEEVTPPRSARAAPVHVQSSSNSPDRVQDPSSSSPEEVHVSSPSSPERGPDRGHLNPDPRDVPSSSSPGRTRQASPTSPDRQHSPESSPGGAPSTLSDHATRSGSPSSPDRGEPADNEPLTGFGSPMVPYPASEDDEEGAIEGAIKGLTSLGAADLTTISKGKRPVLHRSSSESKEIRFARSDNVKRRVATTEDEADGPVSQQAEIAHSWSHENCTAYQTAKEQHKDGFLRCKSVQGDGISYVETNWHQAQGQDPIACLANYWAPMDERDEDFLWSNCTAADRQKFMAELHGHRIQRAGQKAMQFAMAGAVQPSQTQDGAGPSNISQTATTEIGQPIVPAPLSAASLISDAEFLLAGCRDEDMELTRLHGAL
ncbi:hypothetical protein R1sor_023619 [Riccia sorocarpa]|uniref:Aminotransferase-like plant mobile domain-containing protein n=1 Tax=Riccia sorocarpa TaxID=122646 RepID=A0ABD3GNX4_9MARC